MNTRRGTEEKGRGGEKQARLVVPFLGGEATARREKKTGREAVGEECRNGNEAKGKTQGRNIKGT